jgi:hypothetical protein
MKKTVYLPIEVPAGNYCWEHTDNVFNSVLCNYFDNEGGHSTCYFGFDIKNTIKGVLKDQKCINLREAV